MTPAVEVQSLNHWTTREVQEILMVGRSNLCFLKKKKMYFGCAGSSLVAVSGSCSLVAALGVLNVVASCIATTGSRAHGLSSCGTWA